MRRNSISSEFVLEMLKSGQKITVNDFFNSPSHKSPDLIPKIKRGENRRYTQGYKPTKLNMDSEVSRNFIKKYEKVDRKRNIISRISIGKNFGNLNPHKMKALEESNNIYFKNFFKIKAQNNLYSSK